MCIPFFMDRVQKKQKNNKNKKHEKRGNWKKKKQRVVNETKGKVNGGVTGSAKDR